MNGETKLGLGAVVLLALCCAGPLVLSLVGSGAVLAALSAIWVDDRPLLLASALLLVGVGATLLARRHGPSQIRPRHRDYE